MASHEPSPAQLEILGQMYKTMRQINRSARTSDKTGPPFVDAELLSSLPIRESRILFFPTSDRLESSPPFVQPMEEQALDQLVESTWQGIFQWQSFDGGDPCDYSRGNGVMALSLIDELRQFLELSYDDAKPLLKHSAWQRSGIYFGPERWRVLERIRGGRNYEASNTDDAFWQTGWFHDASGVSMPIWHSDCSSLSPHVACTLAHATFVDGRILHSELICITEMIMARMRYVAWSAHRYIPVCCYTFTGNKVRITQACFDGQYLQLFRTDPIEIVPSNGEIAVPVMKMLARWMLGNPIETKKWADIGAKISIPTEQHLQSPQRVAITA